MSLAVEGAAAAAFSTTNVGTRTITTSGTNRIIVVAVFCEKNSATQTVSSITMPGVSFALRKRLQWTKSGGVVQENLEVWWAYAAAQQTAAVITVTLSAATDDATIIAFAVSGVDSSRFANPWDTNAALPATATDVSGSTNAPTVSGISTTAAHTIVFGIAGAEVNTSILAGAGYTSILASQNSGGTNVASSWTEQQAFASAQSGISATFATTNNWGMIADAMTSDVAAGLTPPRGFAALIG